MVIMFEKIRERTRFLIKPLLLSFLLYLLGVSAILRSGLSYMDDLQRAENGVPGFHYYSRYLSGLLARLLHTDSYLTDISPLPQLLALAILALAGICLLLCVRDGRVLSPLALFAVLPLGLNPYFLECISYKYDSPYMALSILAMIAPLLLRRRHWGLYCAAVFAGTLVMCTTYQASSGILPMLTVLLVLLDWARGERWRELWLFAGKSAGAYLAGLLFYHRFILHYFFYYASTSTTPKDRLIPATIAHYRLFLRHILEEFRPLWLILIALLALAFLAALLLGTKRNRLLTALLTLAALGVMLLLSFGVYPLLEAPLFDPRAMYGFGAFLAMVSAVVVTAERFPVGKLACVALSWVFLVFAFTYGNALAAQEDYCELRTEALVTDLSRLEAFQTEGEKVLALRGSIGYAPILRNMPQRYRMLSRLVPVYLREGSNWGSYRLLRYYGLGELRLAEEDFGGDELPLLLDTAYHTIRGDGTHFLISLK